MNDHEEVVRYYSRLFDPFAEDREEAFAAYVRKVLECVEECTYSPRHTHQLADRARCLFPRMRQSVAAWIRHVDELVRTESECAWGRGESRLADTWTHHLNGWLLEHYAYNLLRTEVLNMVLLQWSYTGHTRRFHEPSWRHFFQDLVSYFWFRPEWPSCLRMMTTCAVCGSGHVCPNRLECHEH